MKTIIDEKLDNMIKNMLNNFKETGSDEFPALYIDTLKKYLTFKENPLNETIILHIFIYNFILWLLIYEFESEDIVKFFSQFSQEELLSLIFNNPKFYNKLLNNYLKIIYQDNLHELITDNLDKSEELLGKLKPQQEQMVTTTITNRCSEYLEELYAIYSSQNEKDTIKEIAKILKGKKDPFATHLKYFESSKNFYSYKPFLIQMLHLDAYLFLLQLQEDDYLTAENANILAILKTRIENNMSSSLPDEEEILNLMLTAFYYFNTNRFKLTKHYPQSLDKIKKESRNRIHPVILLNYNF